MPVVQAARNVEDYLRRVQIPLIGMTPVAEQVLTSCRAAKSTLSKQQLQIRFRAFLSTDVGQDIERRTDHRRIRDAASGRATQDRL